MPGRPLRRRETVRKPGGTTATGRAVTAVSLLLLRDGVARHEQRLGRRLRPPSKCLANVPLRCKGDLEAEHETSRMAQGRRLQAHRVLPSRQRWICRDVWAPNKLQRWPGAPSRWPWLMAQEVKDRRVTVNGVRHPPQQSVDRPDIHAIAAAVHLPIRPVMRTPPPGRISANHVADPLYTVPNSASVCRAMTISSSVGIM
jgi:hypothetical protein